LASLTVPIAGLILARTLRLPLRRQRIRGQRPAGCDRPARFDKRDSSPWSPTPYASSRLEFLGSVGKRKLPLAPPKGPQYEGLCELKELVFRCRGCRSVSRSRFVGGSDSVSVSSFVAGSAATLVLARAVQGSKEDGSGGRRNPIRSVIEGARARLLSTRSSPRQDEISAPAFFCLERNDDSIRL
jgi:hypothetical protein